jgi:hypothetical protein
MSGDADRLVVAGQPVYIVEPPLIAGGLAAAPDPSRSLKLCRKRTVGHAFNGNAPLLETHLLFLSFDSELAPPTIASAEEIRYAQKLRRRIRTLYFERLSATKSQWCVGAD